MHQNTTFSTPSHLTHTLFRALSHYPVFIPETPHQDVDDLEHVLFLRVFCDRPSVSGPEDWEESDTSQTLPLNKTSRTCAFIDKMFPEIFSSVLLGFLLTLSCAQDYLLVDKSRGLWHEISCHDFHESSLKRVS